MSRMALLCSLLVVGLTAAALVQSRREASVTAAGRTPPPRAGTPAAAPAIDRPTVERPPVDLGAVAARIEREIVSPIQERWAERASFSRVRRPSSRLHLEMPQPTDEDERPPREDASPFVHFRLDREGGRFDRAGTRVPFAFGRVAVAGGDVELALVRRGDEHGTPRAWQPAAAVLRHLGVDPTKTLGR